MARYIDADKAKELWSGEHPTQIAMRRIFDELPTADVAPRAEVAREIFEEIDRAVEDAELEWGTIFGVKLCIAELKKKYTEDNNR